MKSGLKVFVLNILHIFDGEGGRTDPTSGHMGTRQIPYPFATAMK